VFIGRGYVFGKLTFNIFSIVHSKKEQKLAQIANSNGVFPNAYITNSDLPFENRAIYFFVLILSLMITKLVNIFRGVRLISPTLILNGVQKQAKWRA